HKAPHSPNQLGHMVGSNVLCLPVWDFLDRLPKTRRTNSRQLQFLLFQAGNDRRDGFSAWLTEKDKKKRKHGHCSPGRICPNAMPVMSYRAQRNLERVIGL